MSRQFKRWTGGGAGGNIQIGDPIEMDTFLQPAKDNFDLLALGTYGSNLLAGGDLVTGLDASASGDVDLLNWTPFVINNTSAQFSTFSDANGATFVVQIRYLLRVSNAAITVTPKVRYGANITSITTAATVSGTAACSATNTDFSGANQYQTVTVTLPSGVNLFKPQVTIGGTPATGYQVWARAWWDIYVSS